MPIQVDDSLDDLNPASFKILADAAPLLDAHPPGPSTSAAAKQRRQHYDEVTRSIGAAQLKRDTSFEQWSRGKSAADMSYVILSDSQANVEPTTNGTAPSSDKKASSDDTALSDQLKKQLQLFEVLSARSDIDHPICVECTELLLDAYQKRQASVVRERDAYVHFLKQAQEDIPTDEDKAHSQKALEEVQHRENIALAELAALEAEKSALEDELAALDAEAEALDKEEEKFWRGRNDFTAELNAYQEERDSLQNQLAHDTKLLEALQRTNVYNDTFCIGHDGNFGTINGLRLGRLPDFPVDWAEINAAWGQALLLLAVLAEKLNYSFVGWKLHPVGSTSRIEKLEPLQVTGQTQSSGKQKSTMLDLFSSGDVPLSFGLLHRSFDSGMVAFLDCVRQLGEHVERSSPGLRMPYKIVKDKIGDISIKFGNFGQEGDWTKACKFTLTCCKFLLAHASHLDDPRTAKNSR